MPGVKTNERPGTRAVLRHYRMSATKARQVLDLVRGHDVDRAHEILRATPREAARVVAKVLESAVSNARNNDGLDPEELYVSACYADEGTTIKRWRPRARGRATRIRKRTCHITVIVSRMPEERLARVRARQAATSTSLRARRVAASRREQAAPSAETAGEQTPEETEEPTADELEAIEDEAPEDEEPEAAEEPAPEETEEPSAEAVELEVPAGDATAEEEEEEETEEEEEGQEPQAEAEEEPAPARRRRGRAAKAEEEQPGILRPKAPRRIRRRPPAEEQAPGETTEDRATEESDE